MNRLKRSGAAKAVSFVLIILSFAAAVLCAVAAYSAMINDYYTSSPDTVTQGFYSRVSEEISYRRVYAFLESTVEDGHLTLELPVKANRESGYTFAVYDADTGALLAGEALDSDSVFRYSAEFPYHWAETAETETEEGTVTNTILRTNITVRVALMPSFPRGSEYYYRELMKVWLYENRYTVLIDAAIFSAVTLLLYVFLLSAAGHKKGKEGITPGMIEKIPFDLFTGVIALIMIFIFCFADEHGFSLSNPLSCALVLAELLAVTALFVTWSVSFAVRCKEKSVIRNTVVYRVIRFLVRHIKRLSRYAATLTRQLPMVWKTVLVLAGLSLAELIGFMLFIDTPGMLLLLWLAEKAVLIPVILLAVINLKKLQAGGQKLAEGDLNYQIDTSQMIYDFKKHAENLNSIRLGMSKAVDERMKSERFKTELITNVSHDIKTPLTSVINYVDLLKKENPEGEKVREYLEVLDRQSSRLKKLIEDLVEASKASSGSLTVHLCPCYVSIILTQAIGEYQEKLKQSGLELVVKQPEQSVQIMADGRRLWRVFDNLLNNICKHALPGSRVYLTLEQSGNTAVITFKNISKYELDISGDELMERFVRGDKSRNTEGSGLGLSIAKSLTELQQGGFDIQIDGDLFKAVLTFKVIASS